MNHNFLRLSKIALSYKGWMMLAALLGFLTVGSSIGLMMTSAYIIAKAALHPSIAELQVAIVGVRFFGISRGIFRYLERYVSHEVTFKLLAKFRVWFYRAVEPLAPARLMRYKSGDLLTRLVADVESLEHIYIRVFAPPLIALLISLLMWILFGLISVVFSLLLMLFFFAAAVGVPILIRRLSKETGEKLIELRSELNAMALDGVQGMAELLVFGQAQRHLEKFDALNREYITLQRRMAQIGGLHESLIGLLMNFAVLSIMIAAIPQVSASVLDGVYLSVLAIGTMAAFEAVLPLPAAVQHLESSLKASKRLFEISDSQPPVQEPATPRSAPKNFSLSAKALTFSYSQNEAPVLKNISFELAEGGALAIVGPSGAGKTTLLNLLLRFWEYEKGLLCIGGTDIRNFTSEQLRSWLSVVSQNTHLFNGTVRENLLLGNPSARENDILSALERAQIREFVERLPQGLDTWIGEQGLQLSGGERRRLAITRALLKNAPLMIFDEPTANLDALSEREIFNTIRQLTKQKTTLVITHRLIGLENADEILVFLDGKIAGRGRQDELLAKHGVFRKMWEQQRQMRMLETGMTGRIDLRSK
jgi:ATP-binding cassette subfamily C protein CydC